MVKNRAVLLHVLVTALALPQTNVPVMMDGPGMIVRLHIALMSCPMRHRCALGMVFAPTLTIVTAMMDIWDLTVRLLIALVSLRITQVFVLARANVSNMMNVIATWDTEDTIVKELKSDDVGNCPASVFVGWMQVD